MDHGRDGPGRSSSSGQGPRLEEVIRLAGRSVRHGRRGSSALGMAAGRLEVGFRCDRVPLRGRTLGIVPTQAGASEGGSGHPPEAEQGTKPGSAGHEGRGENAVRSFGASYPVARGRDCIVRIGNEAGIPGRHRRHQHGQAIAVSRRCEVHRERIIRARPCRRRMSRRRLIPHKQVLRGSKG